MEKRKISIGEIFKAFVLRFPLDLDQKNEEGNKVEQDWAIITMVQENGKILGFFTVNFGHSLRVGDYMKEGLVEKVSLASKTSSFKFTFSNLSNLGASTEEIERPYDESLSNFSKILSENILRGDSIEDVLHSIDGIKLSDEKEIWKEAISVAFNEIAEIPIQGELNFYKKEHILV